MKGPKKIFPDMPFGNMDSDRIEARKGLLETFLKVGGLIVYLVFLLTIKLFLTSKVLYQHSMYLYSNSVPSLK